MTSELGKRPALPLGEIDVIAGFLKAATHESGVDHLENVVVVLKEIYGEDKLRDAINLVTDELYQTSRGLVHEATELMMDVDKIEDII